MLLGVLDIGSNSAQLQVFEVRPGAPPLPTHAVKQPTLLSEALDSDGVIDPAGVDRVIQAVNDTMSAARRLGVQHLYVFTTSAVRDAPNRELVLDRVEAEAGVRPQFLTGVDEGRLTYLAVHQWYGWSAGRQLILDIGGGSMEIVFGRDAEPELSISLPLGAGRLTRAFLPDDPPTREQVAALRRHVRATLREAADRLLWEGVPDRVIGASKTFKQLARLSGSPAQRKGAFRSPFRDQRGSGDMDSEARPAGRGETGQVAGDIAAGRRVRRAGAAYCRSTFVKPPADTDHLGRAFGIVPCQARDVRGRVPRARVPPAEDFVPLTARVEAFCARFVPLRPPNLCYKSLRPRLCPGFRIKP